MLAQIIFVLYLLSSAYSSTPQGRAWADNLPNSKSKKDCLPAILIILIQVLNLLAAGYTAVVFKDWVILPAILFIGLDVHGIIKNLQRKHVTHVYWIKLALLALCFIRWTY